MMHFLSAAAFAAALLAGPALAQDPREPVTVSFTYDASDLATPEGKAHLLADLERQARQACQVSRGLTALGTDTDARCVAEAMDAALDALGVSPLQPADAPQMAGL